MTAYSKESLDKLLYLIDKICLDKENTWFKEKLRKMMTEVEIKSVESNLQFDRIEKYLKIDGVEIIDYSDIANETIRTQLFRDCIEMSKYRLGKINDTINFDEYCRYAHLQAEELINFFYNEKFYENIEYIIQFIKKYNPLFNPYNSITSLNQINYSTKLSVFFESNELIKGNFKATIDFLNHLRNELSHRNSLDKSNEDQILTQLVNKNIDVRNYWNYKENSKEDNDLYNKGRFIYLKRKQDYNGIMENLNNLKVAVILSLKK